MENALEIIAVEIDKEIEKHEKAEAQHPHLSGYYPFPYDVVHWEQSTGFWKEALSDFQLDSIIEIGDALPLTTAITGSGGAAKERREIRDSSVAWLHPTVETQWIFDEVCSVAKKLNRMLFNFDLNGLSSMQYTVYDAEKENRGQYYDWHIDRMGRGDGFNPPRKLSLVLNLSDPKDYEGGDLMIHGLCEETAGKERGLFVAFPSYALHKVTPVTKGVRKTLVIWFTGPDFR